VVLIATGAGGCTDTLVVPNGILVNPSPIAAFSVDTLSSLLNALQFNNLSQGATEYFWDFGDGETSEAVHPTHLFPGDGGSFVVCLAVVNTLGCPDTLCAYIGVRGDPGIHVPNTFTPNDDGLNDVFMPVLNGFVGWNYRLLIFDRWGEVIHESRDPGAGWNGRARGEDAQIDVYVWKVIVERDGDARDFIGHVSLVR
jgi:gliding motility-associated-like protein